jgi:hypothetical protein
VDPRSAKPAAAGSEPEPLRVRGRDELARVADVVVALGEAPDGLPLVLDVVRAAHLSETILDQLGQPDRLPPPVAVAMAGLDGALAQAARAAGMLDVRGTPLYRCAARVGDLLGDTLLVRALGGASPIAGDDGRPQLAGDRGDEAISTVASVAPVTLMKTPTAGQRHVGLPLHASATVLVGAGDEIEPDLIEPLRLEDLRRARGARFVVRPPTGPVLEGALADAEAYRAALATALATGGEVAWTVSSAELGRFIAELARSVGALHEEGRVHGDVKPANAVVTAAGVVAIDPIGVVAGQVAPGATPGWAAPEQILARPILPASDVYPLGLMVARLLGAVITGEERTFVVPLGRGERRRVRLLSDHDVYLAPDLVLPVAIRNAWQELLRQALEFDPDDRIASTTELADRIDELLRAAPLEARWVLPGGPGRIRLDVELAGTVQPAWVVTDRRSPCS